jgi:hypothetical protein
VLPKLRSLCLMSYVLCLCLMLMSYVVCLMRMSSVAGAPEAAVAYGADSKFAPFFLREAAHNQVCVWGGGRWGFGVGECACVHVCVCREWSGVAKL